MTDTETIAVYDAKVDDYANCFASTKPSAHVDAFLKHLPDRARILDLGCGPGTSARHFMAAGHRVDAIDASTAMVAAARKLGVDARQASFDAVEGSSVYDGIWANFSLLHAPRAEFPGHIAAIGKALKPGGVLHLGMKTGSGEHRDALGRFYAFYSEEELRDHLTDAGLSVFDSTSGAEVGLAGTEDPFVILVARA